jgi:hypothetical protein
MPISGLGGRRRVMKVMNVGGKKILGRIGNKEVGNGVELD